MSNTAGPDMGMSLFTEDAMIPNALLGEGLLPEAERHLKLAGLSYHLGDVAETHLREAQALAPDHAAILIGLYRFYFYKGRLNDTLNIARLCLKKAAQDNNLPDDWRDVKASDAVFGSYDDMLPRFFLFTLKGYAYLQMRLGNIEEGLAAVLKLMEIDPTDKIGAKVLFDVIERMETDDES
jgi:tetratricopeptide (TPR) repeat protein